MRARQQDSFIGLLYTHTGLFWHLSRSKKLELFIVSHVHKSRSFFGILDRICESPKRRAHLWVTFTSFIKKTCKHGLFWHIWRSKKVGLFSLSHAHESMSFLIYSTVRARAQKSGLIYGSLLRVL